MIFQNRRLILARKIVIEWRFHVFGFMYYSCLANRFLASAKPAQAPPILSRISSMSKLPNIEKIWIVSTRTRTARVSMTKYLNDWSFLKQTGSSTPHGMNSAIFPMKFTKKRTTIRAEIAGVVNRTYTLFSGTKLCMTLRYSVYVHG